MKTPDTHFAATALTTADMAISEFVSILGTIAVKVKFLDGNLNKTFYAGKNKYSCVWIKGVPNCTPDTWRIRQMN